MISLKRIVSIILFSALALSACNLPPKAQETESPGAVLTAAALTVDANLTQLAVQNTPTAPAVPTSTTAPPTVTLAVSAPTNALPAATTTQDCDKAEFVTDVSIPDGTALDPNESFTKTWRLKNTGTCPWTSSYSVVFSDGDAMSGPASQALTGTVNPGQTVDISVNLKAPSSNGSYRGNWKLRNASGLLFSLFYVDIKVGDSGGGKFAVTSVTYTVSTFNDGTYVNCPKVTAKITTNGPGDVTYDWTWSDGGNTPSETITFNSAGTKSVEQTWKLGSGASGTNFWIGIYINEPNHQDFGHANVSKCTSP